MLLDLLVLFLDAFGKVSVVTVKEVEVELLLLGFMRKKTNLVENRKEV